MEQMNGLTPEKKALLDLLANTLFGGERSIADGLDWDSVFLEARQQSVAGIIYSALPQDLMPEATYTAWTDWLNKLIANNMQVAWEHCELHSLLTEHNFSYSIMKGCVSASYYPDSLMRSLGDVDFLIKEQDARAVGELLEAKGFVKSENEHAAEIAYYRGKSEAAHISTWELHWEPNGLPKGKVGAKLREYLADVIDTAVAAQGVDGEFMRPSEFHHGLMLVIHAAHHMINSGIGLRHMCDWAVFVNSMEQDKFVAMFEPKMKSVGMWRFAQLLTALSTEYLGLPSQPWAQVNEPELLEQMLLDIFNAGNFGEKDEDRIFARNFLTNRSKGGVDDTPMWKQALLSANEIVRLHWPVADKAAVLFPIGWVFFGTRYFVRMMLGKRRKVDVGRVVRSANERRPLYQQFELFKKQSH